MPDEIDLAILELLTENARRSYSDLAEAVGLSPPAVSNRVERLQEAGIIRGFTLDVDRSQLETTPELLVTLVVDPEAVTAVAATLRGESAVEHCFVTAEARIVVHVALPATDVREWLLEALPMEVIERYDVSLLSAVDRSAGPRATGFSLSCAECGNTVTEEGTTARIDGTRYQFCCSSCETRFTERYERHADAAD